MSGDEHGYTPYTRGCRCEVCRAAKADYVRSRRAELRQVSARHTVGRLLAPGSSRFIASIPKHGTIFGYQERSCRCFPCTEAKAVSDQRQKSKPVGGAA